MIRTGTEKHGIASFVTLFIVFWIIFFALSFYGRPGLDAGELVGVIVFSILIALFLAACCTFLQIEVRNPKELADGLTVS
ncbi:MAG: hypothetical protein ACFFCP_12580 [Promethearchaeota archaeon]